MRGNRFRYNAGIRRRALLAGASAVGLSRKRHPMKLVAWIIRIVLFALLFVLALRNTADASLQLFFDVVWRAPLILILLAAFALGVVAALAAVAPGLMRQRMEVSRLRRALADSRAMPAPAYAPSPSSQATAPYNVIGPKV